MHNQNLNHRPELPKTSVYPDILRVQPHNRGLHWDSNSTKNGMELVNPDTASTASNKPNRTGLNSEDDVLNMPDARPKTREAHGIFERKGCIAAHLR
jgi:hypothetical protein